MGHHVEVVALWPSPQVVQQEGVIVHRVAGAVEQHGQFSRQLSGRSRRREIGDALALWQTFLEIHNEKGFDLIDCSADTALRYLAGSSDIPTVIRFDGSVSAQSRAEIGDLRLAQKNGCSEVAQSMNRFNSVIASNAALAKQIGTQFNYPANQINTIGPALDTDHFCPDGPLAIQNTDQNNILFVGNVLDSSFNTLLQAIPLILETNNDVRLIIIGQNLTAPSGCLITGPNLAKMKTRLGLDQYENSVSLYGRIPVPLLPACYRSSKLCIAALSEVNYTYHIAMALASGCPVVAYKTDSSDQNQNWEGTVTCSNSPVELAREVTRILHGKDVPAADARQLISREFDYRNIANRTADIYESLLQKRGGQIAVGINSDQISHARKELENSLSDVVSERFVCHQEEARERIVHSRVQSAIDVRDYGLLRKFIVRPNRASAVLPAESSDITAQETNTSKANVKQRHIGFETLLAGSHFVKDIPKSLIPSEDLLVSSLDGGLFSLLTDGKIMQFKQPGTAGLLVSQKHLISAICDQEYLKLVLWDNLGQTKIIQNLRLTEAHDVRLFQNQLYVVSTGTNEVASLTASGKILESWRFPGGGDAWHLNSLDEWNERIVACAFGKFSHHRGFLGNSTEAGIVFDLQSQQILWDGLSKPHTPRVDDRGWKYICDSERERLLVDRGEGQLSEVKFPRTFPRGLAISDQFIYVGLSVPRNSKDFAVTQSRLARVAILDRSTLEIIGKISIPAAEIYDIVLPNAAQDLANDQARLAAAPCTADQ